MGFSSEVKSRVLVASARYCCVCHRHKGLKIEVHHIVPQSEGGANTFENAIPLCFDCHADAGHYNPSHPKGTRYSRKELIMQRDAWYKIVREHKIEASQEVQEHLHFRHLVLRDYDVAKTIILDRDLTYFPFSNSLLIENEVSEFIKFLFKRSKLKYQVRAVRFRSFGNKELIRNTYKDKIKIVPRSDPEFPYYSMMRIPDKEELLSIADKLDSFVLYLLHNNIPTEAFCRSVFYEEYGCGENNPGQYAEDIIFREYWYSFLAITNFSTSPVMLEELKGSIQPDPAAYSDLLTSFGEVPYAYKFPKVSIGAGQTVVLPTALIGCPFENDQFNEITIKEEWLPDGDRSNYLYHFTKSERSEAEYKLLGEYLKPNNITFSTNNKKYFSEIHELDMTNLYVYDRVWHIGSCPHLFYNGADSSLEYVQELFARFPGVESTETHTVPAGIIEVIIAELEDEISYFNEIRVNDKLITGPISLRKGETFRMVVSERDTILLKGYYVKEKENVRPEEKSIYRNNLISSFLKKQRSSLLNSPA